MVDLKKFKKESKQKKMSETAVYLLRKFQAMFDDLNVMIQLRTRHFIRFSGTHTTVGGTTTEEISVVGVKASHRCHVSVHTLGVSRTYVIAHKCEKDKIIVELNVDPGSDHILEYTISV